MIIIYVGDIDQSVDSTELITEPKILSPGSYLVNFCDVNKYADFCMLLDQADRIIYNPPGVWHDEKSNISATKENTLTVLRRFQQKKLVENLPPGSLPSYMSSTVDTRRTSLPQIWIAGCSISHGIGITESERYGEILSRNLGLQCSWLTCPRSSVAWASDQIIRSDIRPNDIVVFGLTHYTRMMYLQEQELFHVNVGAVDPRNDKDKRVSKVVSKDLLDRLDSEDNKLQNLLSIIRVVRFCESVGVRIILADMFHDNFIAYLADFPNYMVMTNFLDQDISRSNGYLDLALDNQHPGPMTHAKFAEILLDRLK